MKFFRRTSRSLLLTTKMRGRVRSSFFRYQGYGAAFVMFFLLFALQACSTASNGETKTVITVGSTRVDLDQAKRDFNDLFSDLPESARGEESIRKEVLNQIVDHYLVLEYGKKHHIRISDAALDIAIKAIRKDFTDEGFKEALLRGYIDFDQWKEQLRKRLLQEKIMDEVTSKLPPPDHTAILHYYESHSDTFRTKRQVRFRQIVTNDLEKAKKVLKRIQQGEDFGTVARETSVAPEAENGGLVGWVEKGELETTMDRALFSLKLGQLSKVVHSPYGYHIFQVVETRPAGVRPLPEVTPQIEKELSREAQSAFLARWVKELRKHFKVEVNPKILQMLEQ
jgi:peptidyl-prolyl cis-trans isomerase C